MSNTIKELAMINIEGNNRDKAGRFVPEQSGNPAGRKKGSVSFSAMIKKVLAVEDERLRITNLEAIIDRAVDQAKLGDARAREWLSDRAEGKAVQAVVTEDPYAEWKNIVRECYEVTDE